MTARCVFAPKIIFPFSNRTDHVSFGSGDASCIAGPSMHKSRSGRSSMLCVFSRSRCSARRTSVTKCADKSRSHSRGMLPGMILSARVSTSTRTKLVVPAGSMRLPTDVLVFVGSNRQKRTSCPLKHVRRLTTPDRNTESQSPPLFRSGFVRRATVLRVICPATCSITTDPDRVVFICFSGRYAAKGFLS